MVSRLVTNNIATKLGVGAGVGHTGVIAVVN